ncbi:PadR family transcriptional regulator [Acholeplasma granularum]|uniref:PadR family transcriptional regulator n=1 Tax=Acholeplasma granularum TaxID=264635 RepID=UPI0004BA87D0|nr:helix-turn-helix transcriptional regulator [Acholeplasma granularum]
METILNNLIIELKRGTQILFVLSALKSSQYGYSLLEKLQNIGVEIEAGTLYPLLRRLDEQGLINSTWDTTESRPRKYYKINENGLLILEKLINEWSVIEKRMKLITKGESI